MIICMQSRYNLALQISECVLFLLTIENNMKEIFFFNGFDEEQLHSAH